jgi:hypothetical protein
MMCHFKVLYLLSRQTEEGSEMAIVHHLLPPFRRASFSDWALEVVHEPHIAI